MSSNLHLMPFEKQKEFDVVDNTADLEKMCKTIESLNNEMMKPFIINKIRDNCVCRSLSLPKCGTCDVKIKELLNEKI